MEGIISGRKTKIIDDTIAIYSIMNTLYFKPKDYNLAGSNFSKFILSLSFDLLFIFY